jgi:hypothetical protein
MDCLQRGDPSSAGIIFSPFLKKLFGVKHFTVLIRKVVQSPIIAEGDRNPGDTGRNT